MSIAAIFQRTSASHMPQPGPAATKARAVTRHEIEQLFAADLGQAVRRGAAGTAQTLRKLSSAGS